MFKATRIYKMRNENDKLIICLDVEKADENSALDSLAKGANFGEISVDVKKFRNVRSADANAYFWVLCDKIAKALNAESKNVKHLTKEDIYKEYIKNYGDFVSIPLQNNAIDNWCKQWSARGIGWVTELVDNGSYQDYKIVNTYFGSSTYDSKQMAFLIDAIVQDAKDLGIETKSPNEIAELKSLWEDAKKCKTQKL